MGNTFLTSCAALGQARFWFAAENFTAVLHISSSKYFSRCSRGLTYLAIEVNELDGLMLMLYKETLALRYIQVDCVYQPGF